MTNDRRTVPVTVILMSSDSAWPVELIGGKGLSLFRLAAAALPVPPFFVLTTSAWTDWQKHGGISGHLRQDVRNGLKSLELATGRSYGTGPDPLLVSIRSSGPRSMPGMMDTVLNVGLTPETVGHLYASSGRLPWIHDLMGTLLQSAAEMDIPLGAEDQVLWALSQIFASWNNDRATLYRELNQIDHDTGTAVVVQAMVFGNLDSRSCSGVVFSRDPVTGSATPTGAWVPCAQGEAVVQGSSNGLPLTELDQWNPSVYQQLLSSVATLERVTHCAQDIEFTVQQGQLYLLQCRTLKVQALAACRINLDMFDEGLLTLDELVDRLRPLPLDELYSDHLAVTEPPLATGSAASPGVGSGVCVLDPSEALERARAGLDVVLVRPDTSPKDFAAMKTSRAIVTGRGSQTSHAAIVARELRIPCVVGCGQLAALTAGREATVDGSTGFVYPGRHDAARTTPPIVRRAMDLIQSHGEDR